jgi:hypothetical protein
VSLSDDVAARKDRSPVGDQEAFGFAHASDELGAPEDAPADLLEEHEPRDAAPAPSLESVFVAENQCFESRVQEPMLDEIENRFAAHIVHGMSKLT